MKLGHPRFFGISLAVGVAIASQHPASAQDQSFFAVVDIATNDVLNVREFPTVQSRIVGVIPPNARGVQYLDKAVGGWLLIRYGNFEGWASGRYLRPERAGGAPLQGAASTACLSYTTRIYLTGTLLRIVFPGRPNYESVDRGDEPEPYFVLHFERPVCVNQDPTDNSNPAVPRVTDLQLILQSAQYQQLRPFLGQQIRVSGILMAAETGHHHTPVLLNGVQFGE